MIAGVSDPTPRLHDDHWHLTPVVDTFPRIPDELLAAGG
jgi:hypothetical protein